MYPLKNNSNNEFNHVSFKISVYIMSLSSFTNYKKNSKIKFKIIKVGILQVHYITNLFSYLDKV